jgi:hypothetical protein
MDECDKEKTAFVTCRGLYQFRVMAFGLCNAGACFERLMICVLAGLNWQTYLLYLDDVIIFAYEHIPKKLRTSWTDFGIGHLVTAAIFSGSVEIPSPETTCPRKLTFS